MGGFDAATRCLSFCRTFAIKEQLLALFGTIWNKTKQLWLSYIWIKVKLKVFIICANK